MKSCIVEHQQVSLCAGIRFQQKQCLTIVISLLKTKIRVKCLHELADRD